MSMESKSFSRERALEKIKKCLALAESTNPNEAESALRQARKLMEKYQLEMSDVDSSRADEYVHQVGKATRQSYPSGQTIYPAPQDQDMVCT